MCETPPRHGTGPTCSRCATGQGRLRWPRGRGQAPRGRRQSLHASWRRAWPSPCPQSPTPLSRPAAKRILVNFGLLWGARAGREGDLPCRWRSRRRLPSSRPPWRGWQACPAWRNAPRKPVTQRLRQSARGSAGGVQCSKSEWQTFAAMYDAAPATI